MKAGTIAMLASGNLRGGATKRSIATASLQQQQSDDEIHAASIGRHPSSSSSSSSSSSAAASSSSSSSAPSSSTTVTTPTTAAQTSDFTKRDALDCLNYLNGHRQGDVEGNEVRVGLVAEDDGVKLSDKEIKRLLDRMMPYVDEAEGTEMFFRRKRQELLAMLTSPVIPGKLRWFYTEAQPDLYISELYDNIVTSGGSEGVDHNSSIADRRIASDQLSKAQRSTLKSRFPALSARMHDLHQDIIWNTILFGEDKPLGKL